MNTYGNSKVDALLAIAGPSLDERDYAVLAIAALDKMGVDPVAQDHMRALVDAWLAVVEARKHRERTPEIRLENSEVASCTQGDWAGGPRRHGMPGFEAMDICQDVSCPLQPPHIRALAGGR